MPRRNHNKVSNNSKPFTKRDLESSSDLYSDEYDDVFFHPAQGRQTRHDSKHVSSTTKPYISKYDKARNPAAWSPSRGLSNTGPAHWGTSTQRRKHEYEPESSETSEGETETWEWAFITEPKNKDPRARPEAPNIQGRPARPTSDIYGTNTGMDRSGFGRNRQQIRSDQGRSNRNQRFMDEECEAYFDPVTCPRGRNVDWKRCAEKCPMLREARNPREMVRMMRRCCPEAARNCPMGLGKNCPLPESLFALPLSLISAGLPLITQLAECASQQDRRGKQRNRSNINDLDSNTGRQWGASNTWNRQQERQSSPNTWNKKSQQIGRNDFEDSTTTTSSEGSDDEQPLNKSQKTSRRPGKQNDKIRGGLERLFDIPSLISGARAADRYQRSQKSMPSQQQDVQHNIPQSSQRDSQQRQPQQHEPQQRQYQQRQSQQHEPQQRQSQQRQSQQHEPQQRQSQQRQSQQRQSQQRQPQQNYDIVSDSEDESWDSQQQFRAPSTNTSTRSPTQRDYKNSVRTVQSWLNDLESREREKSNVNHPALGREFHSAVLNQGRHSPQAKALRREMKSAERAPRRAEKIAGLRDKLASRPQDLSSKDFDYLRKIHRRDQREKNRTQWALSYSDSEDSGSDNNECDSFEDLETIATWLLNTQNQLRKEKKSGRKSPKSAQRSQRTQQQRQRALESTQQGHEDFMRSSRSGQQAQQLGTQQHDEWNSQQPSQRGNQQYTQDSQRTNRTQQRQQSQRQLWSEYDQSESTTETSETESEGEFQRVGKGQNEAQPENMKMKKRLFHLLKSSPFPQLYVDNLREIRDETGESESEDDNRFSSLTSSPVDREQDRSRSRQSNRSDRSRGRRHLSQEPFLQYHEEPNRPGGDSHEDLEKICSWLIDTQNRMLQKKRGGKSSRMNRASWF